MRKTVLLLWLASAARGQTFTIHASVPAVTLSTAATGATTSTGLPAMEVRFAGKPEVVQSLAACEDATTWAVDAVDYDFDGYLDLVSPCIIGTGQTVYSIWRYDVAKKGFVHDERFVDMATPIPDPATKTIRTESRSMAGADYAIGKWTYEGDDLVLLEEEKQEPIEGMEGAFRRTVSKRTAGSALEPVCEMLIFERPDPKDPSAPVRVERRLISGKREDCCCANDPWANAGEPGRYVFEDTQSPGPE
jgi:hypothetical protein